MAAPCERRRAGSSRAGRAESARQVEAAGPSSAGREWPATTSGPAVGCAIGERGGGMGTHLGEQRTEDSHERDEGVAARVRCFFFER
jgi:hypothetical protein